MKKKILACLTCSVLVVGLLALAGCGTSSNSNSSSESSSNNSAASADQEAISKDLTSQLDSFKSSDSKMLAETLKANDASLQTLGIDSDEFAKALLDGFTYDIGTISVNDKAGTAIAEVNTTSKTATTVLAALVNNIPSAIGSLTADDISSEDKVNKFIGKQLVEAAKSAATATSTFSLTYTKSGDTWKMDDAETQLYKALGFDTINLDSIYSQLGVGSASELESYINQYLPK